MNLLKKYFELQGEIYKYFGYFEDWVVIPLRDSTDDFWKLEGTEKEGEIRYATTMEALNSDGDYYENSIYTQRFLGKYVYRGKDYTMICVDTHTDGNKFLQVFSNSKEVATRKNDAG